MRITNMNDILNVVINLGWDYRLALWIACIDWINMAFACASGRYICLYIRFHWINIEAKLVRNMCVCISMSTATAIIDPTPLKMCVCNVNISLARTAPLKGLKINRDNNIICALARGFCAKRTPFRVITSAQLLFSLVLYSVEWRFHPLDA